MDGVEDCWDNYAGYLQGDGYTLATICNNNETNRLKTALKLRMLAPGQYTITDVTGLKPELSRKADGGLTIKPDPQASLMKVLADSLQRAACQGWHPLRCRPARSPVFS